MGFINWSSVEEGLLSSGRHINSTQGSSWSFVEISLGLAIPVACLGLNHCVFLIDYVKYRPWLVRPLDLSLSVFFYCSLFAYSLYVFRKHRLRLLPPSTSFLKLFKEFLWSLAILLIVYSAMWAIDLIIEGIFHSEIKPGEFAIVSQLPPVNSLLIVVGYILGFTVWPVAEELFFRGFLYNAIKSHVSPLAAGFIQAAVFAAVHPYDAVNTYFMAFLFGVALVIVYEKRKNLISPVLVHAIYNALFIVPLLVLIGHNYYRPATNWDEAIEKPEWLRPSPPAEIERQGNGMEQWLYAINKWGSQGERRWKMEMNAFNAVCIWFPQDRKACAKAKVGMITIYQRYLLDYRRSIVEAENLLQQYRRVSESMTQRAGLLHYKAWG
ncbi:MAG: CPBP family intramembrane glutamic endopeptidase [Thermodesulfobacteriota bacterium]|nr:CPBP family intramembrane glutamic endopeptidase [Thermodesulfobacteriota bacterium]